MSGSLTLTADAGRERRFVRSICSALAVGRSTDVKLDEPLVLSIRISTARLIGVYESNSAPTLAMLTPISAAVSSPFGTELLFAAYAL